MNRRIAFATLSVALVLGSAGSANAFFGLLGGGCGGGCGCEADCGCEPSCGCEQSCGCEPSCGCDSSCGHGGGCCLFGGLRGLFGRHTRLRLRLRSQLWLRTEPDASCGCEEPACGCEGQLWLRAELRLRIVLRSPRWLLLVRRPAWPVQPEPWLRLRLRLRVQLRLRTQLRLRLLSRRVRGQLARTPR